MIINTFVSFVIVIIISALIFLAREDYREKEITAKYIWVLLFTVVFINILVFVYQKDYIVLFDRFVFSPMYNFLGAIVLTSIVSFIVIITGQKGMGWGDVFVVMIIGFTIGLTKGLFALVLAVLIALVVESCKSMLKKRKNLLKTEIPFIPYLVTGMMISIFLYPILKELVLDKF